MFLQTARCFLAQSKYQGSAIRSFGTKTSPNFVSKLDETERQSGFPKVTLKRNRQSRSLRDGSQLVFSGSIESTPKSLRLADLVLVDVAVSNDSENKNTVVIGLGVYNPESMYRVRILCHSQLNTNLKLESMDPTDALDTVLAMQFAKALDTRRVMGLPSEETDTYRLVNGEGDGVSGLAVDIVGGKNAVVMSSAAWCEVHKLIIIDALRKILPEHEIIWKTTPSRLRQDGYEVGEGEPDMSEDETFPVIATENGIKYQTFPLQKGQKTSVYCDQRENRLNLAKLCEGKRVLDLCCYHGGFSLNAAKNKAALVTGVDSSQDAIDTCVANAELNNFGEIVQFVKSDIAVFMKECNEKYDVIVLDPPKLAPSMSSLNKASKKYHSLNRDALKLMSDDGGLFMTCTCSSAMTQKDGGNFFLQTVQQASLAARRQVTLVRVSGAASCHTQSPASFPAGNYLTAALFYVHALN